MPSPLFLLYVFSSATWTVFYPTAESDMIKHAELKVSAEITCGLFYDSVAEFLLRNSGKSKFLTVNKFCYGLSS